MVFQSLQRETHGFLKSPNWKNLVFQGIKIEELEKEASLENTYHR